MKMGPMAPTSRVLVLFAHPAIHKSRVNRRLASLVRELRDVTFHDALGFGAHQAVRAARLFRRQDELHLRELAKLRHDRPAYVNVARQRIADMQEVLGAELGRAGDSDDTAWDTSSLREEFGMSDRGK